MTGYHQLTLEQRYQIAAMISIDAPVSVIASQLGVHRSTIYRERCRNRSKRNKHHYGAREAHQRMHERRVQAGIGRRKIRGWLRTLVELKLRIGWSPEQISGRLLLERGVQLSYETIYQHVLRDSRQGGWLRYCLRFGGYKYRTSRFRKTRYHKRHRRRLDERPQQANDRSQVGHWERDLVLSNRKGPNLLVLVDRKSRYVKIEWLEGKSAQQVTQKTIEALKDFAPINRTVTNDNGMEFQMPDQLERALGTPVYYTDPASPWQRGSVENVAGLTRQYFRKRQRFGAEHSWLAPALEQTLNFRPRRTHKYKTPHEVLFGDKLNLMTGALSHFGLKTSRVT